MKKVLLSLLSIGAVAVVAVYATQAYFSDIETSKGNILTAGIVDIKVDSQNPWTKTYSKTLQDMKPSQTRYIEFTVRNVWNSNPVNVWKHIHITNQEDGVITEPECEEGKGTWTDGVCGGSYTPRNNMAAYTLYDLYICMDPGTSGCETDGEGNPTGDGWKALIDENQFVRLDNISSTWIYLDQLEPSQEMKVRQSYHLSSWPDAPEPEVTNWAQGDIMTFDMEIYAEQLGGLGPKGAEATLNMVGKNPTTWELVPGASGTLGYNTAGSTFDYQFSGTGLSDIQYCLIYYADPWPGDHPGAFIAKGTASGSNLNMSGSHNFGYDLPHSSDANHPAGAKIWLVPCSDYDDTGYKMTGWSPNTYLFEENLITYDDTD